MSIAIAKESAVIAFGRMTEAWILLGDRREGVLWGSSLTLAPCCQLGAPSQASKTFLVGDLSGSGDGCAELGSCAADEEDLGARGLP